MPGSSADECGQLFPGDRILEVDGHDLREASHDKAVDVIRQTGNTVRFIVQSLLGLSRNESSTNINESSTEASDDDNIMMDGGPNDLEVELTELPPVPPPPGHGDDDDEDSNTNVSTYYLPIKLPIIIQSELKMEKLVQPLHTIAFKKE